MKLIMYGLALGFSIAVPIGPLNIEIMRRNLTLGLRAGVSLGIGASLGDFTYFILLIVGGIALLNHDTI